MVSDHGPAISLEGFGTRWLDCPEYDDCLTSAGRESWPGWTCEHCAACHTARADEVILLAQQWDPSVSVLQKVYVGVRTCAVCARHATTRGFCNRHYQAWLRAHAADPDLTMQQWITICHGPAGRNRAGSAKGPGPLCRIKGCLDGAFAKGLCRKHYLRRRRQLERLNQHRTTTEPVQCCTQS